MGLYFLAHQGKHKSVYTLFVDQMFAKALGLFEGLLLGALKFMDSMLGVITRLGGFPKDLLAQRGLLGLLEGEFPESLRQ